MTYLLIWEFFTIFATALSLSPMMLKRKELNAMIYPGAIVLWLVSTYIWAIDYAGTPLFAITYLHLLPMVLVIVWMVIDYNRIADPRTQKRKKYLEE